MKRRTWMILAAVLLIGVFSFAVFGCGGGSDTPAPDPNGDDPKAGWPGSLTIGAASIGGTYYVYAGGWSSVIEKAT
ncbi:MAG: C4-dicarboxylate ABC transporter substrate-binding protein, partial [Eubacteriales bacterium]|nr:C4-dicarboxylate ABC transporter substrate-binding protein [Eubacteriales bacterium]